MPFIAMLFEIAGSLGLFLFGMRLMSDGLQKAAGDGLQKILNYMTANRFVSVLTGFAITAFIQSSSATTVMVVSFVNAGLLNLFQSIGVIMGANIGTTVTGWIVAILGFKFKITSLALPAVGIGFPLILARKLGKKDWGEVLVGFGLLFLGLSFLKGSVPDIKNHPEALAFVSNLVGNGFFSFTIFVLLGTILTIMVQSSSAAMAITLTMAYAGWIDFPTAAAIILGENIGTTITAFLASIGTDIAARRAARAHMVFNLLGVVWIALIFQPFIHLVDLIAPGDMNNPGDIPQHLAMFHTLFNISNTLLCLPFIKQIARLVEWLIPQRQRDVKSGHKKMPHFVSTSLQNTPEMHIVQAKQEIARFGHYVSGMFDLFVEIFNQPEKKQGSKMDELKAMEEETDMFQEELSRYLIQCYNEGLTEKQIEQVGHMLRIVNELESIGDSCYSLALLAQRRYKKKMHFQENAEEGLKPYMHKVKEFLDLIETHLLDKMEDAHFSRARELEDSIDAERIQLKKTARKNLQKGADVKAELLFIDVVRHVERIGDYSLNIAFCLKSM